MSWRDTLAAARKYGGERAPQLVGDGRGQAVVNRLIAVVTIGVAALVGVLIYDSILTSLGDPSTTNAENRTQLENATVDLTGGVQSAMDLVGVVMVVLVAAVVVGIVSRLR